MSRISLMHTILKAAPNLAQRILGWCKTFIKNQDNRHGHIAGLHLMRNLIKYISNKDQVDQIIKIATSLQNLKDYSYNRMSLELWVELGEFDKISARQFFNQIKEYPNHGDFALFSFTMDGYGKLAKKTSEMNKQLLTQMKRLLTVTQQDLKLYTILKALTNVTFSFPLIPEAVLVIQQMILIQSKYTGDTYIQALITIINTNQLLAIQLIPTIMLSCSKMSRREIWRSTRVIHQMILKIPKTAEYAMQTLKQILRKSREEKDSQNSSFNIRDYDETINFNEIPKKSNIDSTYQIQLLNLTADVSDAIVKAAPQYGEQLCLMISPLFYQQKYRLNQLAFKKVKLMIQMVPNIAFKVFAFFKNLVKLNDDYDSQMIHGFVELAKQMSISDANQVFEIIFNQRTQSDSNQNRRYLYKVLSGIPLQQLIKFRFIEKHVNLQLNQELDLFRNLEWEIKSLQTQKQQNKNRYQSVGVLVELSKYKDLQKTVKQVLFKIADQFKLPENHTESKTTSQNQQKTVGTKDTKQPTPLSPNQIAQKQIQTFKNLIQIKVKFLNKLLSPKELNQKIPINSDNYHLIVENQIWKINTNIPLARQFLKKITHHLLSDGQITEEDFKFIINCIKCDLTINVTRDGKIILQDKTYHFDIKKNSQARKYFEKIVQAALQRKRQLVQQYTSFKPFFQSKTEFLTKSASDIQEVNSIILPYSSISNIKTTLSLLNCSKNIFCLVQKRNFFGDLLIYKIGKHNILSSYTCHPLKIDTAFKQNVLGPIKDEVFQIISEEITAQTEAQLQNFLKQQQKSKKQPKFDLCKLIRQKYLKGMNNQRESAKWRLLGYEEKSNEVLNIRVTKLEIRMANFDQNFFSIEERLEKSGTNQIAEINKAIEGYEKESPKLGMYYKVFYWTLNSYFYNFKSNLNGMNQANTRFDQKYGFVEEGFKQVGNMVLKLAQGIPVIGEFVGYLDGIVEYLGDTYYEHKFENKKNAILKLIMGRMDKDGEISKVIQKTAIQIIRDKRMKILYPTQDNEESIIQEFFDGLRSDCQKLKSVLIEEEVSAFGDDDLVAKMATRDATLLLSYLYKNSDRILQRIEPLHQQFAQGLKIEEEKADKKASQSLEIDSCCPIYKVHVRYDNEILNHPWLVQLFFENGIPMNQILQTHENK